MALGDVECESCAVDDAAVGAVDARGGGGEVECCVVGMGLGGDDGGGDEFLELDLDHRISSLRITRCGSLPGLGKGMPLVPQLACWSSSGRRPLTPRVMRMRPRKSPPGSREGIPS